MLIMRKIPLDVPVKELTVGDEILIHTKSFGSQILDVVRDDERGLLLMFEDCIMESAMNEGDTNKGGFADSFLNRRLYYKLKPELPEFITRRLIELSVPTYGMIFGHDEFYDKFEPDSDDQLPCMKVCKNRIVTLEDDTRWYWLRNATKKDVSATPFAYVDDGGGAATTVLAVSVACARLSLSRSNPAASCRDIKRSIL